MHTFTLTFLSIVCAVVSLASFAATVLVWWSCAVFGKVIECIAPCTMAGLCCVIFAYFACVLFPFTLTLTAH